MGYKSVHVCDTCRLEAPASGIYGGGMPLKWWRLTQIADTEDELNVSLSFCSSLCLSRYTARQFGEGG